MILETIADFMVQYYSEIQASAGVLLFSITSYYAYHVVQNLEEKQEYALARFFLKRKTGSSFLVISISALVLSFGMALKNIGRFTDNNMYIAISLLSHILMFLGIAYFTFNIYLITKPGLNHADGKKEESSEPEESEHDDESDGSDEKDEEA